MAELGRRWSPYNYVLNNPIRYIDPDGMYSTEEWKKDNGLTDDDLVNLYKAPKEERKQDRQNQEGDVEDVNASDPEQPSIGRQLLDGTPVLGKGWSSGEKIGLQAIT